VFFTPWLLVVVVVAASHLSRWFIAFNTLVLVVGSSPSTNLFSALEALVVLSIISVLVVFILQAGLI
jgi:hypothetical protein